jgi:cephalosporin-C deacetylase-like acetyl esterase
MRFPLAVSLCILFPAALCAQDKKDIRPGDVMIEKYLAAETDKLSAKFLDGAKTIDEWKQKRPRLYQEYMDMLGLWPIPEKTPLKATVTGTVEAHGVVVEKVHFQSKPGLYVTANVYRALNKEKKTLPAIVYVCGHSSKGRDGNKTAFQDHGFWFANNGYVCIILDTLQLGEIPGVHHGTYGTPWRHIKEKNQPENRFWWHSIGYSPAAVECWNGVRAIDYLCTRPDVDPAKIGVTGISGGGAATFWIAAADERVKVAVPVSGMADLESYVKDKLVNSHCDCMFLYNTYQWDWTTIAALVAPRPMLFANSDKDAIFPMDANRRIITKLKKIYTMYEQPNFVDEYVSVGGHDYRPDLRVAVFRFFNKHLKGDTTSKVEDCAQYTPIKGRDLRVFPEDADVPKDALNARIDETFIPAAKVASPEKGKFAEWKKEMIARLRGQSLRKLDALYEKGTPVPAGKEEKRDITIKGEKTWTPVFITEPGIDVLGFPLLSKGTIEILYVDREELNDNKGMDLFKGKRFWVLWPRGNAMQPEGDWRRKTPPNFVERSHVLLGRTVDDARVWDILAAAGHVREKQKEGFSLAGERQAGILAAYAALFEPSIKEVIVINPPKSHKEGPHFLNVLRVLDIPEALGLLAPTPLTIIGGNDPAFDRTAEIYRLAGAADKLKRK